MTPLYTPPVVFMRRDITHPRMGAKYVCVVGISPARITACVCSIARRV